MSQTMAGQDLWADLAAPTVSEDSTLQLSEGSSIGIVGGGPAGSFTAYFLIEMAERAGIDLDIDIYDAKDFLTIGPAGCNHCGGIVSESLVQYMAADGINIPPSVVQRGIDSYVLHMDAGSVHIETPLHEKRIAAVYRGSGPRGTVPGMAVGDSFDNYLLNRAAERGAHVVRERVDRVQVVDDYPRITTRQGTEKEYDLVVGAVGANSPAERIFDPAGIGYVAPETTKTYISELPLGRDDVQRYLGTSMHVFLLNLPRLEFAALVPKGDFATLEILGDGIDKELIASFLSAPEVRACLPPLWNIPANVCRCAPQINVREAVNAFADRIVLTGDCGVARLYKDGIGSAYRSAKALATTAVMEGVSAADFREHYEPTYRAIASDNKIGKLVFLATEVIQKVRLTRKGVLKMVAREQAREDVPPRMSTVLWDTFTGSAPYRDVFMRTLQPAFLVRFAWDIITSIWRRRPSAGSDTEREAAWTRMPWAERMKTAK